MSLSWYEQTSLQIREKRQSVFDANLPLQSPTHKQTRIVCPTDLAIPHLLLPCEVEPGVAHHILQAPAARLPRAAIKSALGGSLQPVC
jgi:hypothetical protein